MNTTRPNVCLPLESLLVLCMISVRLHPSPTNTRLEVRNVVVQNVDIC